MYIYKATKRNRSKATCHDTKIYPHTKFGIPTQIIYIYALGSTLPELKPEVSHSDLETVGDSPGPKMYLQTKYGTATIDNIGDLLWVHFFKT